MDTSAVIDMEVMNGDESDYETNFAESGRQESEGQQARQRAPEPDIAEQVKTKMAENVGSYVWQAGAQKAKQAFSLYGNIDILRPYFDVEPHQVRMRLLKSLVPSMPGTSNQERVHRELYGPTMVIFTLIALLLLQMKTSGHTVQEGTLMGSAFGVCFGYWFGASGLVWLAAYVCNSKITMLQLLSLIGYALFGHCVVLGLTTLIHTSHDHVFFYVMWAIFGGLSTLKLISVFTSRTAGQTQKLIVCGVVSILHLCFLLYLHFAYHKIVEDLSYVIENVESAVAQPVMPGDTAAAGHHVAERSVQDNHADKLAQVTDNLAEKLIRTHGMVDKRKPEKAVPQMNNGSVILGALADKQMNKAANTTRIPVAIGEQPKKDSVHANTAGPKPVNGTL